MPYRSSSSTTARASEPPVIGLRSAFNTTAPANHLPSELVVKVLTSGAWTRWQDLVALTHICQHWRNVALGTPQLWADAARSAFAGGCIWLGDAIHWPKCLPIFLARSEPFPLKVDFSDQMHLTSALSPGAILQPHMSRLAHLSIPVRGVDMKTVLQLVSSHIQSLESLCIPHVDQLDGAPFSIDNLPSWDDADLPRLHTLVIHGRYFGKAIAVASLKTLVLYAGPHSHDVFLAALDRCGPALKSLTLEDWSHPVQPADPSRSAARTVQLPSLRRLEVAHDRMSSNAPPPALLFAGVSFSPDVTVDLDWHYNPGNTHELLPKHLTGLHAPPFFDSMCLHFFRPPQTASLHCYVGDTERLRVGEEPVFDLHSRRGRGFGGFPDGHRWPTVTQLAVDLDIPSPADAHPRFALPHLLHAFVGAFPNLRRLDLLGISIGTAKLHMVDAFLGLSYGSESSATPAAAVRTLGYVCEVPEHAKALRITGYVDELRTQLDELEARLTHHLAHGAARLHRLELCITYSSRTSHPPPQAYPHIRGVSPSTVLTAYLSSIYLPRFNALVDEVIFVGDAKTRVPGYRRIVTGAARQPPGPRRLGRGEKGAARAGRKG